MRKARKASVYVENVADQPLACASPPIILFYSKRISKSLPLKPIERPGGHSHIPNTAKELSKTDVSRLVVNEISIPQILNYLFLRNIS